MSDTFTLVGTGGAPHASANAVTFQAGVGDELTLPIVSDNDVEMHMADLYIDNEIIALINFTYDEYLNKDCKLYRNSTGETFEFKLIEGNIHLR